MDIITSCSADEKKDTDNEPWAHTVQLGVHPGANIKTATQPLPCWTEGVSLQEPLESAGLSADSIRTWRVPSKNTCWQLNFWGSGQEDNGVFEVTHKPNMGEILSWPPTLFVSYENIEID